MLPQSRFLPAAENRELRDVRAALPAAALLERAAVAVHGGGQALVRTFLSQLLELEREDPRNPAPCLTRGRALLLVLDDPQGAVGALEEALRRGYKSPDLDRLLAEARERLARKKDGR
jgi:predicted Zn-dependent protease